VLEHEEQTFRFEGLPHQAAPPALSLLRGFSAPVRLEMGRPTAELVHLLACDTDPFARWDAGQVLLRQAVRARAAGAPDGALEEALVDAFGRILADPSLSEASRSVLLDLPGMAELEDAVAQPDPPALFAALQALKARFGEALAAPLADALKIDPPHGPTGRPQPSLQLLAGGRRHHRILPPMGEQHRRAGIGLPIGMGIATAGDQG